MVSDPFIFMPLKKEKENMEEKKKKGSLTSSKWGTELLMMTTHC